MGGDFLRIVIMAPNILFSLFPYVFNGKYPNLSVLSSRQICYSYTFPGTTEKSLAISPLIPVPLFVHIDKVSLEFSLLKAKQS